MTEKSLGWAVIDTRTWAPAVSERGPSRIFDTLRQARITCTQMNNRLHDGQPVCVVREVFCSTEPLVIYA